ncbi:TetR family transcriptional regulator [Actinomycetospora sp. NBRC 106375]|uniref:TetR/AcrR family transcriptional regulator n=1 Tax=Actinomycetospora sp. NBRC 106375 TaxID=3032207 RepID=UPI0024A2F7D2|nr:TetR/AcrR family transcriptional regulator [Actinomycetospora sp. NBRC 106375]GLZ46157.1 TetR family transcriptional regulator [Actinomycetospora sp. NBRC 106375]
MTLTPGARRILEVASDLFYERGIHAVGVDTIAAESGVTKRTLYDRFGSKDELVAAYLRARDERWRERVTAAVEAETDPRRRALAPFAVLEDWAADRGCAFVNAFAELDDPGHPGRAVVTGEKEWLRALFAAELTAAGADDVADLALHLLVLHEGALVAHAVAGQPAALRVARDAARGLVERAAAR